MSNITFQPYLHTVTSFILFMMVVLLLQTCGQSWRPHQVANANLHTDTNGKDFLLIRYSYFTSGKGPSYTYQVLQSIDPSTGEKLGEYSHTYKNSRGSFSLIHQDERLFYFKGKKYQPYCLSLPELEEVADPKKITEEILEKNPKIKDIFELKVLEGVFKINSSDAYTYWISPEDLKIINETEALKTRNTRIDPHPQYSPLGKFWKDYEEYEKKDAWIRIASGKKPKQSNTIITIDTIDNTKSIKVASKFAINYAVIDSSTYQAFVLEGDLRRRLLEVLKQGIVRKLEQSNSYIKGIMLRPYRKKGQTPDKRWAIITQKPQACFIFHQSEMDEKKASFFLSKASLENGKELWKVNLSKLDKMKAAHYPEYNWLYKDTLICLFTGSKRNQLLCFNVKDGSLKWRLEI